ncbi:hypothetical protein GCM10023148_36670 [Actinokineospora soli]
MLSLSPPFFTHDGVVVARDHSDPRQFWYFPNRPRLAVDDAGRPAVRLLVYKEDLDELPPEREDAAGFLVFDTSLAWPQATLDAVARKIADDLDLDEPPRLAPILCRSGKAKLTFLDRASGPEPDPARDDWVVALEATTTPALYGENRAIFSVMLTKEAAALVLGSFDGFLPAGVLYELTYPAMQRAFNVHVEADWSLVYSFVQEWEKDRHFFFSQESEEIVEKLVENKVVTITGSLEGVDEEGMAGEFAEVRKQLSQFVWEKFFEPKPNPRELLDKDAAESVLGFIGGFRDAHLPLDFGSGKRTLDVEQLRALDIDYTVERAVERTIAPQAHLSLFWQDFTPPLRRDQVITVVRGDDDLWRQVRFAVLASADFAADAVQRVVVDIAYGPHGPDGPSPDAKRWSLVLDAEHQRDSVAGWYEPRFGTTFHYRYTVAFGPDAVVGEDVLLTSDWREASGGAITVNPNELYRERRVEFQRSSLLGAQLFPEVLVHLSYGDPSTGWRHTDSGLLTAAGPAWSPVFRTRDGAPGTVAYELEYVRADSGRAPVVRGSTDSDLVVVNDPRENLVKVVVIVADRALDRAIVTLEYVDDEHGIYETATYKSEAKRS